MGGALVLQLPSGPLGVDTWGVVLLAGACLCWAIDNNLTQRLSLRDPFAIVPVKTHWHRHEPLEHEHPHLPDAHHRHEH